MCAVAVAPRPCGPPCGLAAPVLSVLVCSLRSQCLCAWLPPACTPRAHRPPPAGRQHAPASCSCPGPALRLDLGYLHVLDFSTGSAPPVSDNTTTSHLAKLQQMCWCTPCRQRAAWHHTRGCHRCCRPAQTHSLCVLEQHGVPHAILGRSLHKHLQRQAQLRANLKEHDTLPTARSRSHTRPAKLAHRLGSRLQAGTNRSPGSASRPWHGPPQLSWTRRRLWRSAPPSPWRPLTGRPSCPRAQPRRSAPACSCTVDGQVRNRPCLQHVAGWQGAHPDVCCICNL